VKDKKSFYKLLAIEAIIICTIAIGYFFNDIKSYIYNSNLNIIKSECVLNSGVCKATLQDESILSAQVSPKEIFALQQVSVNVQNNNADSIKLVVSGINMDMGTHEFNMQKMPNNTFEAKILLPSCSIDMHWDVKIITSKPNGEFGVSFGLWSNK
jgi:hypothetical protein